MTQETVHKPRRSARGWCIVITQDKSPFSPEIERIECGHNYETAWQTYRQIMKEKGLML
jgi:hypothetical protein